MRLAFSVAAYLESEILIVDEVLAVGDAGFQKKCTEKMLEISNRGRTLLFVSHSMDAVNKLCSHAIELSHGRLVSRFKAERPIEHPTDSEAIYVDGEHSGTPSLASARDVTSEYLLRDKFFGAERKWEPLKAPSFRDGAVTLLAVRILDRKGKLRRSFDVKESFFIEYEFVVNEEKWAMNAHVYLKTLEGQNILLSMDNLDLPNPEAARRAGRHIERCEIATPLLNEGVYTIEVVICTHPTTEYNIVVPEAASFVITDDMSPEGVRGNWSREWNTYPIRPRMHWTIRHEPPADERPVLDGETPGVQIPHHRESHS
jgi:lipopolysaccharide transport system ATP-binding protein